MIRFLQGNFRPSLAWLIVMGLAVAAAPAQDLPMVEPPGIDGGMGDSLDSGLGGFGFGESNEAVVTATAVFTAPTDDRPAELYITAEIQQGWHIYSITQPPGGPLKTEINPKFPPGVKRAKPFEAIPPPKKAPEPAFDNLMVESHEGKVIWRAPLEVAPNVDLKTLKITGIVVAQPCDASSCLPPTDYGFTAVLGAAPVVPKVEKGTENQKEKSTKAEHKSLIEVIGWAFLGGLILNLMPCVLPVISLKLLSFIQQGGESPGRVFMLNVWYSLGLLLVFMILASLAATVSMGWGQHFTLPWFKVTMTAIVFVMALSFLNVWEIPIPGFVGSGAAGKLQTQEGPEGAFAKGAFATILATPCSGPFLGPVFGFLLDQPPYMAYVVFGSLGLGMASPYLVIGAFPRLIAFLPKPGAWMDTFKQIMGFLLLGTVVYLFWTMSSKYFVPTLALLVGLWFACWWIGRTPLTASSKKRATAWVGGLAVAALIGLIAFGLLLAKPLIAWQPFSPTALATARAEGKTVMVDFTAHWCPTCQMNSKWAIETKAVKALIEKNGVVPLLADWTDRSPMIKQTLNEFGRDSIPMLIIWPADAKADQVIRLDDVITEGQLLEALKAAGPSRKEGDELVKPLIAWQPFSPDALAAARSEGKTVMVNFMANWDLVCQMNSKTAIETKAVEALLKKNRVVPLLADWTDPSPMIKQSLNELGRNSIPVLAIWPADAKADKVIVLDDVISEGQLLEALEAAGPSREGVSDTVDTSR